MYNNLEQSHTEKDDLKEVLLKVYTQLNETHDDVRLVNRLTNYIYSTALTEHITFNSEQQDLITQLNKIGGKSGLNNTYRSSITSKFSF